MAKRSYEKGAETHVSSRAAIDALEENNRLANEAIDRNFSVALLYLVRAVEKLSNDLHLLDTYVRRPGSY